MSTVIGYTTGVFDMFHIGHLNLLRRASRDCDELVVGVTTDELSLSRKGKLPIVSFAERAAIVAGLRQVDRVVEQSSMDKMEAWERIRFNVMFVGDDWRGTQAWDRLEREFGLRGVRIAYFPYTGHTSSTVLRAKVYGS